MSEIPSSEIWQIDANGQIYEAPYDEMTQWILEGSVLPSDKVRRGNLRWIEAGKVPLLIGFFETVSARGIAPVSYTVSEPAGQENNYFGQNLPGAVGTAVNFHQPSINSVAHENGGGNGNFGRNVNTSISQPVASHSLQPELPPAITEFCCLHDDAPTRYYCQTCGTSFCGVCPKSYGGNVRICPFCDNLCVSPKDLKEKAEERRQQASETETVTGDFGFSDFSRALGHPFRYKISLAAGIFLAMFFAAGQTAAAIGGFYLMVGVLFSMLMSNTMTFGVLANTVDNFSQGKLRTDFMPSFDDFSLWEDAVHPFFLSIGVYLVSFGVVLAIGLSVIWSDYISNSQKANAVLRQKAEESAAARNGTGAIRTSGTPDVLTPEQQQALNEGNIAKFAELKGQAQQLAVKNAMEASNELPPLDGKSFAAAFLAMAFPLKILFILGVLWGIFYFPIACAVAGYTRSFKATVSPNIGFDTIKHLGADYLKLWLMFAGLTVVSTAVQFFLESILSVVNLPKIGNLPAFVISSGFNFFVWVVFCCLTGYALYKNRHKLQLAGR